MHQMLHEKAHQRDADPAGCAEHEGLGACFDELDHVAAETDRSHRHDDEELAKVLERGKDRCSHAEGGAGGRDERGDNEQQDEEREG